MIRSELHSHIPIQGPKCYIPLESVYYLFVTYCHEFCNKESQICRWICSHRWKRTLKVSYLIQEWWKRASRIYLVYQVVHCHRHWDFEEYTQTHHEAFNQTLFVQNYPGGGVSQYILQSGSLWHPRNSSMPKNKRNVEMFN